MGRVTGKPAGCPGATCEPNQQGPPLVEPFILTAGRQPFNHPEWLFEPKYDGYRGLLYVTRQGCHFRSKRGNILKRLDRLCYWVREELPVKEAILDSEAVALDADG